LIIFNVLIAEIKLFIHMSVATRINADLFLKCQLCVHRKSKTVDTLYLIAEQVQFTKLRL